ncbi:MAG: hypothetical protein J5819_02555 [Eubacterium sp.]|nr:hypothetical protein [Eubacterium sp.]
MNREEFIVCRDYAALDLAFSLDGVYDILFGDTFDDRRELFGAPEKGYYDWLARLMRSVLSFEVNSIGRDMDDILSVTETELRELRRENKKRMEFFTVLTDRLTAYEYVLNRYELKYAPEDRLDDFLKSNPEDAFLNRLIIYLTKDRDKKIFGTKLQSVIGEIPVQITRNKLFEHIDRVMKLYLDSDETALDELLYMLRMASLVMQPGEYLGEYPLLEKPLNDFETTVLDEMDEAGYNLLRDEIFDLAGKLESIMDYYHELQRCVNDTLALCLVRKWLPEQEVLVSPAVSDVITHILDGNPNENDFVPFEGRIEEVSLRLQRQMARVEAPDMNAEEEEEYLDVATLARLLSNSMFAEIDPLFVESRTVTKEMLKEKEEKLFNEMTEVMKASQKPVRRAIIAKVLEKLPPFISSQDEIQEYVRVNLFNCRDKAERCAVMAILLEMMEE